MKRAVIGCGIIRRDIGKIVDGLPYEADVFWLDEDLHNTPAKLHDALQAKIGELGDYGEIILTYLLCGNALIGIGSDTSRIRFLRGDDCIYAQMCLCPEYRELRPRSFFLSHGWLSTSRNSLEEYDRTVEKYGERRARRICDALYRNYRNVVYMKLGGEVPEEDREKVLRFAELAKVEPLYMDGSLELYRKLLWLEDCPEVTVLEAGERVSESLFRNL